MSKANQIAKIFLFSFVVTDDIFVAFIYSILTRRIGMMLSLLVSYAAGKDTKYLLPYIISYSENGSLPILPISFYIHDLKHLVCS